MNQFRAIAQKAFGTNSGSLFLILLGLCIVAVPQCGYADSNVSGQERQQLEVPCSEIQIQPLGQNQRLDPARPFLVELGPHRFAVPWAYLRGRPSARLQSCKRDHSILSIQFWIPDGRAPERDQIHRVELQPAETDRPVPGTDEWVIQIWNLEHFNDTPPSRWNADRSRKVSIERFDGEETYNSVLDIDEIEDRSPFRHYYKTNDSYSLMINCIKSVFDEGFDGQKICFAELVLKEQKLAGRLMVPVDAITLHAEIVETLKSLLHGWTAKQQD